MNKAYLGVKVISDNLVELKDGTILTLMGIGVRTGSICDIKVSYNIVTEITNVKSAKDEKEPERKVINVMKDNVKKTSKKSEIKALDNSFLNVTVGSKLKRALGAASMFARSYASGFSTVLGHGPTGTGKTSQAMKWASENGYKCYRFDCSIVEVPTDFLYTKEIGALVMASKDGDKICRTLSNQMISHSIEELIQNGYEITNIQTVTINEPTSIIEALKTENSMILLDEANRTPEACTNSLFQILDSGTFNFNGKTHKVAKNVIVYATMNIGTEYRGAFGSDLAFLSRFQIKVEFKSLRNEKKIVSMKSGVDIEIANKIVKLVKAIGSIDGYEGDKSIRTMINMGMLVNAGYSIKEAADLTIRFYIEEYQTKNYIEALNMV